jgi:2-deoxy-D-gluconate 3-dehydrogenase
MQENTSIKELISLNGKGAIVTGGARGIGLAISRRFTEAGATVLIADTDAEEAQKVAGEIKSQGYNVKHVNCNITKEADVQAMAVGAVNKLGGIDILVNNAGIYPRKPIDEMTCEDFVSVISVNLTGTFLCSRYIAKEMVFKQKGGCILNIASIEALHPSSTGMSAYDASKGGVLMLTKSMARELGQHDIRVNAIAPGAIKTKGVLSHTSPSSERAQLKELKAFLSRIVLGRMGDADDVARVALFLASDLASYITGEMIVVDGGYLIS